jgi:hypothetical protein
MIMFNSLKKCGENPAALSRLPFGLSSRCQAPKVIKKRSKLFKREERYAFFFL